MIRMEISVRFPAMLDFVKGCGKSHDLAVRKRSLRKRLRKDSWTDIGKTSYRTMVDEHLDNECDVNGRTSLGLGL